MLYAALAADFDGTLAHHERVDADTVAALRWLKERGKRLILVSGRELPELQALFPEIGMFDAVVAENGALLFMPGQGEVRALGEPPPEALVAALKARDVSPLSVGSTVIATWEPHQATALECIRDLGLEWQIIFNKGAVMCLPPGVNKASGLMAALAELKLSPLNVVAVGDAQNDHAFLNACGFSCAVANALDSVKAEADLVTRADHGAGVAELINAWIGDGGGLPSPPRHTIAFGEEPHAALHPGHGATLITGVSGGGKSTLATLLIEEFCAARHQFIVLDAEGDYGGIENVAHLGGPDRAPTPQEALDLLARPEESIVLNLLAVAAHDRPLFLSKLLGGFASLRAEAGRPHWVIIDEAHHFLPAALDVSAGMVPTDFPGAVFITTSPELLAPDVLKILSTVIALGAEAPDLIASATGAPQTARPPGEGEALVWRQGKTAPRTVSLRRPRGEHQRHTRKYAEGALSEDKSFFFHGPEQKLNLRANNLNAFLQIAEGVDEDTWLHHLRARDYSRWLRDAIGDEDLAEEVAEIEGRVSDRASEADRTRLLVRDAIRRRYTAPADA